MMIDARELNEFTRKATELMSETADVPRVLRNRLGEQHPLTQGRRRDAGQHRNFRAGTAFF